MIQREQTEIIKSEDRKVHYQQNERKNKRQHLNKNYRKQTRALEKHEPCKRGRVQVLLRGEQLLFSVTAYVVNAGGYSQLVVATYSKGT